jgi:hypothetical protein
MVLISDGAGCSEKVCHGHLVWSVEQIQNRVGMLTMSDQSTTRSKQKVLPAVRFSLF